MTKLEKLTHTDFEQHIDTIFAINYSSEGSFGARLISVNTLGQKPKVPNRRWPYSLVFHVPEKEKYLAQQIYQVTHPDMGTLDLFLVPLGPDETGMRYEAVFT